MKLLIIFSSFDEARYFLAWLQTGKAFESDLKHLVFESPYALYSFEIEGIFVDAVIAGCCNFETAFQSSRILSTKRYHLALQIGTAISNDDKIAQGSICNVINDKAFHLGIEQQGQFQNAYDSQLLNIQQYPHQMGAFVNKTNAYFNVFLDIKKVAGATSNTLYYDNKAAQDEQKTVHNCHIHYLNGLGFSYTCLYLKQSFYQLRIIINNRSDNTINAAYAIETASSHLIEIIKKIS